MSLSAKLRIRSRKDGTEPVVRALTRGMVTVGGVACAVNGMAAPSRIKLHTSQNRESRTTSDKDGPLNKLHRTALSEHEIAPQSIHDHEYDLVERRMRCETKFFLPIIAILPICKTR